MKQFFSKEDNIAFVVKVLWKVLELAGLITAMVVFYTVFEQLAKTATTEEYNNFIEAVTTAAVKNERGGSVLASFGAYMIALVGLPAAYGLLWIHRFDKWFALKSLKKKFKRENELLDKQSIIGS